MVSRGVQKLEGPHLQTPEDPLETLRDHMEVDLKVTVA